MCRVPARPRRRGPRGRPRGPGCSFGVGEDGMGGEPSPARPSPLSFFVSPKPLSQKKKAPYCCVIDTAGSLAASVPPTLSRRPLKAAPAPLFQTATENIDGDTTSLHLLRSLHPSASPKATKLLAIPGFSQIGPCPKALAPRLPPRPRLVASLLEFD